MMSVPQSEVPQRPFLWTRGVAARETLRYLDSNGVDAAPLLSKAADYEFVGPLPPELQDPEHSTWTAGAATKAADLGAAKGFTLVLASSESLGVFKGKGFTPP